MPAMVAAGELKAVIIAKLDPLTRSVKDVYPSWSSSPTAGLRLISVSESLDTAARPLGAWC